MAANKLRFHFIIVGMTCFFFLCARIMKPREFTCLLKEHSMFMQIGMYMHSNDVLGECGSFMELRATERSREVKENLPHGDRIVRLSTARTQTRIEKK